MAKDILYSIVVLISISMMAEAKAQTWPSQEASLSILSEAVTQIAHSMNCKQQNGTLFKQIHWQRSSDSSILPYGSGDSIWYSCPEGFTKEGSLCLHVTTDKDSWYGLKAQCDGLGGQLAKIRHREDSMIIKKYLEKKSIEEAWLGGSDEDEENNWKWIDGGSPVQGDDILNWGESQQGQQPMPNKTNENCLLYWTGYKPGRLGDYHCDRIQYPALCLAYPFYSTRSQNRNSL